MALRSHLEGQPLRSLSWVPVPHFPQHLPRVKHSYSYNTSLGNALTWTSNYWQHHSAKHESWRKVCCLHQRRMLFCMLFLGGEGGGKALDTHSDSHWAVWLQNRGQSAPFLQAQLALPPTGDYFDMFSHVLVVLSCKPQFWRGSPSPSKALFWNLHGYWVVQQWMVVWRQSDGPTPADLAGTTSNGRLFWSVLPSPSDPDLLSSVPQEEGMAVERLDL